MCNTPSRIYFFVVVFGSKKCTATQDLFLISDLFSSSGVKININYFLSIILKRVFTNIASKRSRQVGFVGSVYSCLS